MVHPLDSEVDIAVIGAGAAGLFTALTAARLGGRVALISATPLAATASYWAQGGLAAALAIDDSPGQHVADTVAAGRGLVRQSAAQALCQDAPDRVRELVSLGVNFDADRFGRLALGLEGGHSVRRVVHAGGSATGRRVSRDLSSLVALEPAIEVLERRRAAELWVTDGRCVGLICDDGRAVAARAVILATGGAAAMWSRTTNPPGAFGSGMLLAMRAGAALADLELMQFHPTALVNPDRSDGFLITEAIRGEGATLHNAAGERFVDELAPRDEVARAIGSELEASGAASVGLDMRDVDSARFPNVVAALRAVGIDPESELVPVAPAAHYLMGGTQAGLDGHTTVPGLYAVGECACTGLHGANRLASNSLSECIVFGKRAAVAAMEEPSAHLGARPVPVDGGVGPPSWESRTALWRGAGLVRDQLSLEPLLSDPHPLARLVAQSALARNESRGAHRRTDFPETNSKLDYHHTVIRDGVAPVLERWS